MRERAMVAGNAVVLAAAMLCAGLGARPCRASEAPDAPGGALGSLPPAAQGLVSRTLGQGDRSYHARGGDGGLVLENRRHGLDGRFDAHGFEVTAGVARIGLSLRAAGRGDTLRPV